VRKRHNAAALAALAALVIVSTGSSQNPPAPTMDNVGFPTDYQNWNLLYKFDRPDNKSVRTVYGNSTTAQTTAQDVFNYPYGSIIVMETWGALLDSSGSPKLDADGRFQKDPAKTPTIFVMRKEKGFGAAYGPNRNGEWEYVAYHPDGTYQTTPVNSFSCAVCHLQATQAKDWVFRYGLHLSQASGAAVDGVIQNYRYVPGVITVAKGNVVTIYNDDVVAHTLADDTPGPNPWGPITIVPGATVTIRFPSNQTGVFNFHCTLHQNMHGQVVVQ
jgi:plastocyanin